MVIKLWFTLPKEGPFHSFGLNRAEVCKDLQCWTSASPCHLSHHPVSPPSLHYYTANRLGKVEEKRWRVGRLELKLKGRENVMTKRNQRSTEREREGRREREATGDLREREKGERRRQERVKKEREAQEMCSCGSVFNNGFCVSGWTHRQRTSSVVEVLSQRKNNYQWRQILALLSHGICLFTNSQKATWFRSNVSKTPRQHDWGY